MDQAKFYKRLLATFLEELAEHAQAMNEALLVLERDGGASPAQPIAGLFRAAHSLKGAARSLGVKEIEAACHAMEDIFGMLREQPGLAVAVSLQVLFRSCDALEAAGRLLAQDEGLADSEIMAVLPELRREVVRLGEVPDDAAVAHPPGAPGPQEAARITGSSAASLQREVEDEPGRGVGSVLQTSMGTSGAGQVRVNGERLDGLFAMSGEMLVARRRIERHGQELMRLRRHVDGWFSAGASGTGGVQRSASSAVAPTREEVVWLSRALDDLQRSMAADIKQLQRTAEPLEAGIRHIRMEPFRNACRALPRLVRDVAQDLGKDVALVVDGGDVEVDRTVLEALRDPLGHIVRNAIDHGIEPSEERVRAGKPAQGTVRIGCSLAGDKAVVVVSDDGRGLDRERILECAGRPGGPADAASLAETIFQPGFSTAEIVTEISGRGVGLDVVKVTVEALRGTVTVASEPGAGTSFRLVFPVAASIVRALLVRAGGHLCALDCDDVVGLRRIRADDIVSVEGKDAVFVDDRPVPLATLVDALGAEMRARTWDPGARIPVVVLASGADRIALAVDELLNNEQLVVKPLGERLVGMDKVVGASMLPDGSIALLVSSQGLVRRGAATDRGPSIREAFDRGTARARLRLLLADDSLTIRTFEAGILEGAGYEVLVAPDGLAAWQILLESGADIVVSDVEMPRMDGFTLTETIRRSKRFADLPVILVTALESPKHRQRGLEAGANAYLPKSTFDQGVLLETIARLAGAP